MRNLLRFIINNQFILLFFLLEIISISLLVHHNKYHSSQYLIFSQQVSGRIAEKRNNISQYLFLKEENQQLAAENIKLKNLIASSHYIAKRNTNKDIHYPGYQYISARVINNSVNKQFNNITLDKGKSDGIEPEMAVIAPDGVVGLVETVSEHYCRVISLLNRNLKVSAKFKKNNYFGSFEWPGHDFGHARLNEIPLHVDVMKGDTIVTSGFSTLFPEGVPLATVEKTTVESGTFYTIDLKISTNFKKLNHVYIVKDIDKQEKLLIEKSVSHD